MNTIRPCKSYHLTFHFKTHNNSNFIPYKISPQWNNKSNRCLVVKASSNMNNDMNERPSFLSIEEAGLVEISGLNTHERFLCRLTISSLNLLRVIAEQEGCQIEELNGGRVCDWFLKDKLKREQNIGSAVLQWDDEDPFDLHF